MSMANRDALARLENPDLDPGTIARIASGLEALDARFRPMLKQLSNDIEPAVILSESAVFGQ